MTRSPRVPVRIVHAGPPGRKMFLIGDFPDWQHHIPMHEEGPGNYVVEIVVEPGLYRYKFLLDKRRYVDVSDPAFIDWAEGVRNGVLMVGSATPTLHFAPDRRHVMLTRRGMLVVQAETDEASPPPHDMWIQVADRQIRVPARHGVCRGGRQQISFVHEFGSEIPGDGLLGFTGYPAHIFELPEATPGIGEPPSWLEGAVFYAVFIDRWRRAASSPADPRARPRSAPSTRDAFFGGDLHAIREDLEHIASLGVTAIVLTPVQRSETPHRYDAINLMDVDERIGGMPGLRALVDAAHAVGLKVVGDLSGTHVHYHHWAFADVMEKGAESPFLPWFRIHSFPVRPFETYSAYEFYGDRPDLPLLNLEPGPAREHVIEAALSLLTEGGIDGLRLDALNDAPVSFARDLRRAFREKRSDFLILGEVVSDRPVRFAGEEGIDTATNFQHREAMLEFFAESRIDAAEFWNRVSFLDHRLGPFDPVFRLLFLDNHDTERFLSLTKSRTRLYVALIYMMFRPEPVWITYGTELELHAGLGRVTRLDDAWSERIPLPDDFATRKEPAGDVIRSMCLLRRTILKDAGALSLERADGHFLCLRRESPLGVLRAELRVGDRAESAAEDSDNDQPSEVKRVEVDEANWPGDSTEPGPKGRNLGSEEVLFEIRRCGATSAARIALVRSHQETERS